jgi:endonuclease YncB( thermonuclease family)
MKKVLKIGGAVIGGLWLMGTVMNAAGISGSGWWEKSDDSCTASMDTPSELVVGRLMAVVEHIDADTVEVRINGGAGWPYRMYRSKAACQAAIRN